MFSIANLLDRAKAQANIESDYRLAKVLRINQSALSNYRHGRALPGVEMIESLCALSGDDAGLIVAQVEAARAAAVATVGRLLQIGYFGGANDPLFNGPPPPASGGFAAGPRYSAQVMRAQARAMRG